MNPHEHGEGSLANEVAIVVPCYNEASRLKVAEFEAALRADPKLRFVFVDDGSRDATLDVLQSIERAAPAQVRVVRLAQNSGKAEAVRTGVLAAFDLDVRAIGYWDADLATPLYCIAEFARVLDRDPHVAMVIGARVRLLGRHIERNPARHYIGRVFATLAGLVLELPIYDTQCGAKLFRATQEFREAFAAPFSVAWTFDVELFARLKPRLDLTTRCVEYPLWQWADAPGSKLRAKHFPSILLELAKISRIARGAKP